MKVSEPSGDSKIKEVWMHNLESEFQSIGTLLRQIETLGPPVLSIDTEFPGIVHQADVHYTKLEPEKYYDYMRKNVQDTKLIQLGLTVSDVHGSQTQTWEFNFSDFDPDVDQYSQDSLNLLKKNEIDFEKNKREGITTADFRSHLFDLRVFQHDEYGFRRNGPDVIWVTYAGTFDYGYLMKIIMYSQFKLTMPDNLAEYLSGCEHYFSTTSVFDLKHMEKPVFVNGLSLFGGLENLAKTLGVERVAGRAHQSGSDSLLTLHTFFQMKKLFFPNGLRQQASGFLFATQVFRRTPPPLPFHTPVMIHPSPSMFHNCDLQFRFPAFYVPTVAADATHVLSHSFVVS